MLSPLLLGPNDDGGGAGDRGRQHAALPGIVGVGGSLTDSSAYVLMHDMSAAQRASVMTQLFDPAKGIGLDVLREPVGANDFATANYTDDDMPVG